MARYKYNYITLQMSDYYKWQKTLDFAYKFNTESQVMCEMSEYY